MTPLRPTSAIVSIAIHVFAVSLLLVSSAVLRNAADQGLLSPPRETHLFAPLLTKALLTQKNIGGGGGMRDLSPASAGHLPRIANRQFVPPTLQIVNAHPHLAMEMTIEASPETALLDRNLPMLGDPLSKYSALSGGTGGPLGLGDGKGTGVGNKRGPAAGDGDAITGSVYSPGRGVSAPVILYKVEPEFTEEARKARFGGSVIIRAEIDSSGRPRNLHVVRALGMGLDEKALDAVAKWIFRPGVKDGRPVAVSALIEVSFRLL